MVILYEPWTLLLPFPEELQLMLVAHVLEAGFYQLFQYQVAHERARIKLHPQNPLYLWQG
jgi:hypothetical protein